MSARLQTILSVGFDIPGRPEEYVPFESDRSLSDADIILFAPTLPKEDPLGLFPSSDAKAVGEQIEHWRSELDEAVRAGKVVFVLLVKPEESVFKIPGERGFPGRTVKIGSYAPLGGHLSPKARTGNTISPTSKMREFMPDYWREFGASTTYRVTLVHQQLQTVLATTRGDEAAVAGIIREGAGAWVYIPPFVFDEDGFTEEVGDDDEVWNEDGIQYGEKVARCVIAAANAITSQPLEVPPAWIDGDAFFVDGKRSERERQTSIKLDIERLQADLVHASETLRLLVRSKALLYAKGPALERAVLDALRKLGFKAEPFANGDSEFDAVFVSEEGRCIGEVEGRDDKAIAIDKMRQLETNIAEDFARDDISEHAKGVLFGNAYRLKAPGERPDFFTEKCIKTAVRNGYALVRTTDLFAALNNIATADKSFAQRCRQAIFSTHGAIVTFPEP